MYSYKDNTSDIYIYIYIYIFIYHIIEGRIILFVNRIMFNSTLYCCIMASYMVCAGHF